MWVFEGFSGCYVLRFVFLCFVVWESVVDFVGFVVGLRWLCWFVWFWCGCWFEGLLYVVWCWICCVLVCRWCDCFVRMCGLLGFGVVMFCVGCLVFVFCVVFGFGWKLLV